MEERIKEMRKRELRLRQRIKMMLNKAFDVTESEDGYTLQVDIKNEEAVTEVINQLQGIYEIGISERGGEGGELFYELDEKIKGVK